jgi:2-alkyl-3-oxoalkanoate reductase
VSRHALVTGATGGLGREVVRQLLEVNYRVTATGRDARIGARLGTPFIAADLVRTPLADMVADVDVVFHLAALSSPWGRYEDFRCINVDVTEKLLTAARAASATSFVYASTPSIYAEARDRIGLTEASPVAAAFANAYAETKYAGECAVLAADSDGFRTIAIRPRAIVGPHDTVLLPRLMRTAKRRRFPLPGGGHALIEPTDVRDAAAAFVAADIWRERAGGQAINISGGDPRPFRELLGIIFEHTKQPVRYMSVPVGLAMTVAGVMEGVAAMLPQRPEPPATRYMVKTLAFSQTMRLDLAKRLLDWAPRHNVEAMVAHALA